jgi:hypothetical protein
MKDMATLTKRLNSHFATCAAAAAGVAAVGTTDSANAAIVYSGVVNLSIPNTFAGIYVNMVTGATAGAGFAGQDFNPYNAGANMWDGGTSSPTGNDFMGTAPATPAFLVGGETIGPAQTYLTSSFPSMAGLAPGATGIMGIRFFNEGTASMNYGWIRLTRGSAGGAGNIIDWGYENSGLEINALAGVPAPGALALLALGAVGGRRRQRVA